LLDAPDEDFLARHVAKLREVTAAEDALLSRFQHGSAIPKLLDDLRGTDEKQFVDISTGLATRLHDSMEQSTKLGPGVPAIIVSGPAGKDPDVTSILKLDAKGTGLTCSRVEWQAGSRSRMQSGKWTTPSCRQRCSSRSTRTNG
jgi:hypothetical protein